MKSIASRLGKKREKEMRANDLCVQMTAVKGSDEEVVVEHKVSRSTLTRGT